MNSTAPDGQLWKVMVTIGGHEFEARQPFLSEEAARDALDDVRADAEVEDADVAAFWDSERREALEQMEGR